MKKVIAIILSVFILLVGCSGDETNTDKPNTDKLNSEEVVQGNDSTTSNINDKGVYIGADSFAEVQMGANINGEQTALCTVKMPMNYVIACSYMDEQGQRQSMSEIDGDLVADVIQSGRLDNCKEVPVMAVLIAQGDVDNSYTFVIIDSKTISVESEKQYAPGGVDINAGSDHEAYVYNATGQFDVVLAYEINDDWTLLIENSGELKDKMTLEQIGQELYELVTPIG